MVNRRSHPKIQELIIDPNKTILDGIKQMDKIRRKLLIVMSGNVFVGLLSIGDIQRAIIKNYSLSTLVSEIIRNDYIVSKLDIPLSEIMAKIPSYTEMLIGRFSGSLGEVSAALLIFGLLYMLVKKIISWHIPISVLGSIFIFTGILY